MHKYPPSAVYKTPTKKVVFKEVKRILAFLILQI